MRYGSVHAELLPGPSRAALVEAHGRAIEAASPVENHPHPADVRDTLITILSEKTLPHP